MSKLTVIAIDSGKVCRHTQTPLVDLQVENTINGQYEGRVYFTRSYTCCVLDEKKTIHPGCKKVIKDVYKKESYETN